MKYKFSPLLVFVTLLAFASLASGYKTVEFVSEFGGKGESPGKFSEKTRIAFDKNNNIYVLDIDNLCVQKFDPDGKPVMEIKGETEPLFTHPVDITVDGDLNIYVVDWKPVHIQGTDSPKIFNYGPCIHKFSRDGKLIAVFTLEDLSKIRAGLTPALAKATPVIDTDGNFALMIMPEKPDRQMYISSSPEGSLYILDRNEIYKLSQSGEVQAHFVEPNLDNATGMAVDRKGNIYIADTGNYRVSKFSPDGKFLLSFGKRGDTNGRFTGTLYITSAADGTLLVADSAKYEKIFKTSIKQRKLLDSSILVTGQDDPSIPRKREYETVIRRYQRFDENGRFLEKILYRISKADPEQRNMEFKAIDPNGNLYLIDKDKLIIRRYSIQKPFRLSAVDKTFTYNFQYNESRYQVDNFYDLDDVFDFDEREKYTQMTATLRLNYDMTETFRVSLTNSLISLNSKIWDKYPGEYADPRGFIQDDETADKYISARVRLDLSLILDHDPFRYRVGDLFIYAGGGRYEYNVDATNILNKRRLEEKLWWATWAAGSRYDMGDSLRFSFTVAQQYHPAGFMNYSYTYWEERGELYATGTGRGTSTEVFVSIDGAF